MTAKFKLIADGPILARRYPPQRAVNPDVPGAEWPFAESKKAAGDVVISLAVTPTRRAKTAKQGLVHGWRDKLHILSSLRMRGWRK